MRSPLSVTMPGKTACPMRPERGGITTSARPERRLNRASSPRSGGLRRRETRDASLRRTRRPLRPSPRSSRWSPSAIAGRRSGAPDSPSCTATSCRPGKAERSTCGPAACRHRASVARTRIWKMPLARPYCSTSVLAWRLKSAGMVAPLRSGRRRSPKSTMIAIVPASSGTPDEGELEEAEAADAGVDAPPPRRGR